MSAVARELQAVERLIGEFGATVLIEQHMPFPRSPRERLEHRNEVETQIAYAYQQNNYHREFTPLMPRWSPYSLDRTGRIAIIGEAPTLDDHNRGALGYSRAAKVLRHQLQHYGIDAQMSSELMTVWHWPNTKRITRPPNAIETAASRKLMFNALDAADVDYVLLLGGHAQRAWRNDLTLRQTAGNLYLWRHRWFVCPMLHPNAVLRHDGYEVAEWKRQFANFVNFVTDQAGFESFGTTFTDDQCTEPLYGWDADAVPWCRRHIANFRGQAKTDRKYTPRNPDQGALL